MLKIYGLTIPEGYEVVEMEDLDYPKVKGGTICLPKEDPWQLKREHLAHEIAHITRGDVERYGHGPISFDEAIVSEFEAEREGHQLLGRTRKVSVKDIEEIAEGLAIVEGRQLITKRKILPSMICTWFLHLADEIGTDRDTILKAKKRLERKGK